MNKLREYYNQLNIIRKTEMNTTVGELVISLIFWGAFAFSIGLFLFGWYLTPVEYVAPEGMNILTFESKAIIVNSVSEHYAVIGDNNTVLLYLQRMSDFDSVACTLALEENKDYGRKARLITIASLQNGYGCK